MAAKKPNKQTADIENGILKSSDQALDPDGLVLRDTKNLALQISADKIAELDHNIIQPQHYNRFNFSKLVASFKGMDMTLGVTSANRREGKTVVAANMAVSLAKAYRKSTILVDLNVHHPNLHKIFNADLSPGIAEATRTETLQVAATHVDHLFLLPAGDHKKYPTGIEHTLILRSILRTLKEEFDFVIIDMCSVFPYDKFPVHFINEIDGLVHVIDAERTKKKSMNRMYRHVDEKRFVGYVFNNFSEKS